MMRALTLWLALFAAGGAAADPWPLSNAPVSFLGTAADSGAGRIAPVGDLDGDGAMDIGVGAPFDDSAGADSGAVFLYSGGGPLHRNLMTEDASVVIRGADGGAMLGWSVAGVGDVNGDGADDLAVGAPLQRSGDGSGTVFLFFGPLVPGELDLIDADVALLAEHLSSGVGVSIAGAGDLDGDGFDDLFVGAPFTSDTEDDTTEVELDEHKVGRVHLMMGRESWPEGLLLGNGSRLWITGVAEAGMLGMALATGADISGDGVADACFAAPNAVVGGMDGVGTVYCFTSLHALPAGGSMAGTADFWVVGMEAGSLAGTSLAFTDFNGDGADDLVIGAPYASDVAVFGGAVAGVAGGPYLPPGAMSLNAGLFYLTGSFENGCLGYALAGGWDLTGNGYAETLIGAPGFGVGGLARGVIYLLAGRDTFAAWPDESAGLATSFEGEFDGDRVGTHLSLVGNVGLGDVVFGIGSVHSGHGGHEAGKAYVTYLALGTDDDLDGFAEIDGDCRDNDSASYPGAPEDTARDDDCDGWTEDAGDCDDACSNCFPGAPEIADGLDNDCDGEIDEVESDAVDADGDGWTDMDGDCDDGDAEVYPGAEELCNDADDNCNGAIDDGACGDDDDDDTTAPAVVVEDACGSCATGESSSARAGGWVAIVLFGALARVRWTRAPWGR